MAEALGEGFVGVRAFEICRYINQLRYHTVNIISSFLFQYSLQGW